jgi:hypothetical protein
MAKGKKRSGDKKSAYISKGERPNISRKVVLGMRRDSRNPIDDMFSLARSDAHKRKVMDRPQNAEQRALAAKYKQEFQDRERVQTLMNQYGHVGLTEGAVIHAIRTNWEDKLINKFMAKAKANDDKIRQIMKSKRVTREEATLLAQGKKSKNPFNLRA